MTSRTPLPLADECCAPITREPLGEASAIELAAILKAIADPTRLRLLSLIGQDQAGEMCVCDLTDVVELSQPTVSHHLKVLVDAGILTREKRGVNAYYGLMPGALDSLATVLTSDR
ncbi:ArsR/SmtB family transcription factor [Georgenia ruanii]|uniref:Metalloregulator ArsR/SmtB family transcription factor n=1 Tax=Georgenia ruanii TaxID=348442 RepID=A0A7J9UWV1_9MICO|nr:metalloregulator ArsR/SmtB family transcription factor [Georgenia ruanii]MPV88952.1 metalloregulator ArsR/SmtB family transcription factor [Georgenia ruanii]